jgi:hypothetical protein
MLSMGVIVHVQTCLSVVDFAQSILFIAPRDMSPHYVINCGVHLFWSSFVKVSGNFPTRFSHGVHEALLIRNLRLSLLDKSDDVAISFEQVLMHETFWLSATASEPLSIEIRDEFSCDGMETPFITQSPGHAIAPSGSVTQIHYELRREAKVDCYPRGFIHQWVRWGDLQHAYQSELEFHYRARPHVLRTV